MARPQRSRGFTLVELLVVITIIGMLVSLLLPAIQAAREAGRRSVCQNNMRQAAIALATVEQNKKAFPGYVHLVSKTSGSTTNYYRASWVVDIMPAIEQTQLYQNWSNPTLIPNWTGNPNLDNRGQFITQLSILLCPSNATPDLQDDATSFVVNTGVARTASDNFYPGGTIQNPWPEDAASGVCFNRSQADWGGSSANGIKQVSIDYMTVHDGSTNTLLVTENLQTGGWATDPVSSTVPFTSDFAARQSVGTVWFITGNQDNSGPPTSNLQANYNLNSYQINDYAQSVSGRPSGKYSAANTAQPTGLAYARPSANHSGGVNAMFCGGNGRFLSEEMDYKVLTQLMTPFQNQVVVDYSSVNTDGSAMNPTRANSTANGTIQNPGTSSGMNQVKVPWRYVLDEGDL